MKIKLTKCEAEQVDWALDPMDDYCDELESDGTKCADYGPDDLPGLDGLYLEFNEDEGGRNACEDMFYRLGYQLPAMCDDQAGKGNHQQVSATRMASLSVSYKLYEYWKEKGFILNLFPGCEG